MSTTMSARRILALTGIAVLGAGLVVASLLPSAANPQPPAVADASVDMLGADRVTWVTGPDSPNRTGERWNVHGADLGHPVLHGGELHLVFGDTWGADGSEGSDWRSNTMARIASTDPRDGLRIASMVTGAGGNASELLASRKLTGIEKTVIPTHAISLGEELVIHYMSVRRWLRPGQWEVGHAGFASSRDGGRTWTLPERSRLQGDGGFAQVAMTHHDGHVLVYGIPAGRFGSVRLARATPRTLLTPAAHEYWDGEGWSARVGSAVPVIPGPVGELSVQWNDHLDRWVMMYLDESRDAIVLRTAEAPTGPWSDARLVTTAAEHPRLYAPYVVPGTDTGSDLYFTMSQFGPYQVALMRTSLADVLPGPPAPG